MHLSRARLQYLSAIAAMLPSVALVACKDPAPPLSATSDGATTTATGTSTPLATSTGAATSTPSTTAAPSVTSTVPIAPTFRMPSCPSGAFCIAEGDKHGGKERAPAPYAKCALTATHPDDQPDAGFPRSRSVSFSAEETATERAKTPSACCYTWVIPCPGGRAFRDATGTPSVARTVRRGDWSAAIGELAIDGLAPDARAAAAEHWTREAAFEHASIASFAQLTLDLLAVGAPPELLEASQRAAIDEVEHARISFALAAAYGAAPVGPAALAASPGKCRTLADIARTTFVDACVGESVAAAALAADSRDASDPVLRVLLATMAEDEGRHAELAWRIVAWALRAGDPEVARALSAVQADVIDELVTLGRDAGAAPRHALRANVLREIVLPCSVALLAGSDALGPQPVSPPRYTT